MIFRLAPPLRFALFPKSRAKHDQAWKPNNPGKKGKLGTLDGKFPEYICNPPKYFRRRNKKKE